jgi:hypothetical protein
LALSPEHLLEISDFVLRLMAVSVVHSIILDEQWSYPDGAVIKATTLAYLMEQCQSLQVLTLVNKKIYENRMPLPLPLLLLLLRVWLHLLLVRSANHIINPTRD